jgi:hypothetical protein
MDCVPVLSALYGGDRGRVVRNGAVIHDQPWREPRAIRLGAHARLVRRYGTLESDAREFGDLRGAHIGRHD